MKIKNLNTNHHAFTVSLNGKLLGEEVVAQIKKTLQQEFEKYKLVVHEYQTETLQTKLAREIALVQKTKNLKNEKRAIFLIFTQITPEAQNTFLKALEEPTLDTYFFLITPNSSTLFDTVRSRCIGLSVTSDEKSSENKNFLSLPLKKRLEVCQEIVSSKQAIDVFFYQLESEIEALTDKTLYAKNNLRKLLFESKKGIADQSSTTKYFLESLALLLPVLPKT